MNITEAIRSRRAVKHFDPEHIMPEETKQEILDLAHQAPTAFNIQNWRFVVVEDKDLRQKIREAAWNQAQVTDASLLVILCADLKAWDNNPQKYWNHAPKEVQDILVPAIPGYYANKPEVQRDEAMRSCGMAAQNLMLAALEHGYDSCPMDGFDFEKVGDLIQLPRDHIISMFVVIGKKIKEPWPKGGFIPKSESIILNTF